MGFFENFIDASMNAGTAGLLGAKDGKLKKGITSEAILGREKDPIYFDQSETAQRRKAAYDYGRELGQKEFYDDPDMQKMRSIREDLAKGYDSSELGALRGESQANIKGQRSSYMDQLRGNLAKQGVGGARAAAIQNAGNQKFAEQGAENERKLLLDSAKMKREGINDLQDYLMRQKLGALGLAYGQQSLSSADYAAEKGVQAAQSGGKK